MNSELSPHDRLAMGLGHLQMSGATTVTAEEAIDIYLDAFRALGEKNAEIARLRAELDEHGKVNVMHFLERQADAVETLNVLYADEPDGTIMRATDTGNEWVKTDGSWEAR
jgi:hypothetical protein